MRSCKSKFLSIFFGFGYPLDSNDSECCFALELEHFKVFLKYKNV